MAGPVPGSTPKKQPSPVPRRIGPIERFKSSLVGNRWVSLELNTTRSELWPRLLMISPIANTPTATTMKPMPSVSSVTPKLKRCVPVLTSVPTMPSRSPITTMASDLIMSPCANTAAATRPISISEKYSGAANLSASSAGGGREHRTQHHPRGRGKDRAEGGDGERRPRAALPRHLIAVDAGHHRGGLARQVDQDGGGRAAVLRAVIDAGEHDQGTD